MTAANITAELAEAQALLEGMAPYVVEHALIGSSMYLPRESCNDVDVLVLVGGCEYMDPISDLVLNKGFVPCGEQYECASGTWGAARRGGLNLIITHEKQFYDDYLRAMEVCKALRLAEKKDRVAVCKVVRDRMSAADVRKAVYGDADLQPAAGSAT